MKLVKAGELSPGNKVSINGVLLEVVRILPTHHQEPHVGLVFDNGQSLIAKVNEVFFVLQNPEGELQINNYDGHQQQGPQNFGQQQPVQPGMPVQQGQPQWQPGMPVPPKQKKPFFKRTWVLVTGGILVLFIIIGIAGGGGETPTTDSAAVPSGGVTSSDKPADKPSIPVKTTEAPKPAPKPAAKKWVKLMTLTGSADKQSDTIKTTGGKVRITHTFKDTSSVGGIGTIYFLKEGTDLQTDGGIPEVMVTEAGKDVTTLRKDAGEYFIKVSAANFKYTVVVEEER